MVVIQIILALGSLLDKSVRARHRDVVRDPNIRVSPTTDLNLVVRYVCGVGLSRHRGFHLLCIYDVEYFLGLLGQRLKDNEVLFGAVDLNDVYDSVAVGNFEREIDFAKFAVELFEFDNDLLAVDLASALSLQPAAETLKVDVAHRACAFTRRDKRVNVIRVIRNTAFFVCAPANSADSF